MRAKDEGRAVRCTTARDVRVSTTDDSSTIRTTRIDLGKAEIVFSDARGEMKIDSINGKKQLTAKRSARPALIQRPVETRTGSRQNAQPTMRERFEKMKRMTCGIDSHRFHRFRRWRRRPRKTMTIPIRRRSIKFRFSGLPGRSVPFRV